MLSKKFKKEYYNFNFTIIALSIGLIFIPAIIFFIKRYFPDFYETFRCLYYTNTQNPCPLCGITTDFKNILTGNLYAYKYNMSSIPLLIAIIIEVFFRIGLIKSKNKVNKYIIIIDIIYHLFLGAVLIIYFILFFTLDLARF